MNARFIRFGAVGVAGFGVDAGLLTILATVCGVNPFVARVGSFAAAASATWWLNRKYTFSADGRPASRQWLFYVAAMTLGGLVNYSVFAASLLLLPLVMRQPWIGVALGSGAGLVINYTMSSRFVFVSKVDTQATTD